MTSSRSINPGRHRAVFGFAGWSGSGKTTLVEKVVAHLAANNIDVATIKHAHHNFEADHVGKDSYRHRKAGARQVLVSSAQRSAHFIEHAAAAEPELPYLLDQLQPAELVLIEGFKNYPIEKIEIHRPSIGKNKLYIGDPLVVAVASDKPLDTCPLPVFDLNDIDGIAAFVLARTNLRQAS
jgi:molybdopterin-guanine dinucleotide biosynthesis protein B